MEEDAENILTRQSWVVLRLAMATSRTVVALEVAFPLKDASILKDCRSSGLCRAIHENQERRDGSHSPFFLFVRQALWF